MGHLILLALCMAAPPAGSAHHSGASFKGAPIVAPRPPYVHNPYPRRFYGGSWWSPFWWDEPRQPAPSPVDPKVESPVLIRNQDYVKERLSPQTTLFPEGFLPQPKREPTPPAVRATCVVRMKSGEEIKATSCWQREDVLGYIDERGRANRVSTDLVESH